MPKAYLEGCERLQLSSDHWKTKGEKGVLGKSDAHAHGTRPHATASVLLDAGQMGGHLVHLLLLGHLDEESQFLKEGVDLTWWESACVLHKSSNRTEGLLTLVAVFCNSLTNRLEVGDDAVGGYRV